MDEEHHYILRFNRISCLKDTTEVGHDEVYFEIYKDGSTRRELFYENSPINMKHGDTSPVDITIDATYLKTVKVQLREKDAGSNPDDWLGSVTLDRNIEVEDSVLICQTTGDAKARYRLYWRIIDKPIPTLRILGIKCHKQHSNCDEDLVDEICDISSKVLEKTSDVLGKSPRPGDRLLAKAFDVASNVIDIFGPTIIKWICHACDGADDVYVQRVFSGDNAGGGAFAPSDDKYFKMRKDDQILFRQAPWLANTSPEEHYYRFPLDRGDVHIQLREKDPFHSLPMGKITITEEEYNERKERGAVVKMCDEYWRGDHQQGQGALYSICYSVGLENWALPANKASQDRFVIQDGWAAYIVNRSNKEVLDFDEEDETGDGPDVITRPKGVSVSQRWFLNPDGSIINMKNRKALYPACSLGGPLSDKHLILFQYFGELPVTSFDFGFDGIISNCEYLPTALQVDSETKKVSLEVEDYKDEQLWDIEYIPRKNIEIFKQVVISFVISEEYNVPYILQIDPAKEPGEVNVWAKPEKGPLTAAHTWFLYKDGTIANWMNGKLLTFDDDGGTPNQINVVARGQVFTPDPPDNQKFDCFENGLISSRVCGKVLQIDPELGDDDDWLHYNVFLNDEYEASHEFRGHQLWRIEYFNQ